MSSLQEEVGHACSALEMVCRCNATTLSESFNKFGCDLLEVLVFILKDFYRKDMHHIEQLMLHIQHIMKKQEYRFTTLYRS